MLNNLRVDPLEQRLLQRVRLVPRNLVLQNQRPEQTKDQLQITVDDVLRVDVDQLDTVRNDELERLVRVFQPRHPHLRVLVELEVDLLLPHRFKQRNHHKPFVQVLLNVVDDVRAIQLDVRPFRERLLRGPSVVGCP